MINTSTENFDFTLDALVDIGDSIAKWGDYAVANKVDVKKQVNRIVQVIIQAPSFDTSRVNPKCSIAMKIMREVAYDNNTLVVCMVCFKTIQINAIALIEEELESESADENQEKTLVKRNEVLINQQILFQSMYCNQIIRKIAIACIKEKLEAAATKTTNLLLYKIYETELWNLLPPKRCLETVTAVESKFNKILQLLLQMDGEIERDNLGINSFNQCNGCGSY